VEHVAWGGEISEQWEYVADSPPSAQGYDIDKELLADVKARSAVARQLRAEQEKELAAAAKLAKPAKKRTANENAYSELLLSGGGGKVSKVQHRLFSVGVPSSSAADTATGGSSLLPDSFLCGFDLDDVVAIPTNGTLDGIAMDVTDEVENSPESEGKVDRRSTARRRQKKKGPRVSRDSYSASDLFNVPVNIPKSSTSNKSVAVHNLFSMNQNESESSSDDDAGYYDSELPADIYSVTADMTRLAYILPDQGSGVDDGNQKESGTEVLSDGNREADKAFNFYDLIGNSTTTDSAVSGGSSSSSSSRDSNSKVAVLKVSVDGGWMVEKTSVAGKDNESLADINTHNRSNKIRSSIPLHPLPTRKLLIQNNSRSSKTFTDLETESLLLTSNNVLELAKWKEDSMANDRAGGFHPGLDYKYHKMLTNSLHSLSNGINSSSSSGSKSKFSPMSSLTNTSGATDSSHNSDDVVEKSATPRLVIPDNMAEPLPPTLSVLPLQDGALRIACVQAGTVPKSIHSLCDSNQLCAYCLRIISHTKQNKPAIVKRTNVDDSAHVSSRAGNSSKKKQRDADAVSTDKSGTSKNKKVANVLDNIFDTAKNKSRSNAVGNSNPNGGNNAGAALVSVDVGSVSYNIHKLCSFALSLPLQSVIHIDYTLQNYIDNINNTATHDDKKKYIECSSMYPYDQANDADCDICSKAGGIMFFYRLHECVSDLPPPSEEGWLGHVPCLLWLASCGLLYDRTIRKKEQSGLSLSQSLSQPLSQTENPLFATSSSSEQTVSTLSSATFTIAADEGSSDMTYTQASVGSVAPMTVEEVVREQFIPPDADNIPEPMSQVSEPSVVPNFQQIMNNAEHSATDADEMELDTAGFLDTVTFDGATAPDENDDVTKTSGKMTASKKYGESVLDALYNAYKCSLCGLQGGITTRCASIGCTVRAHALCVTQAKDFFGDDKPCYFPHLVKDASSLVPQWQLNTLHKPVGTWLRQVPQQCMYDENSEDAAAAIMPPSTIPVLCMLCPVHCMNFTKK
jgi:hypothetical protein